MRVTFFWKCSKFHVDLKNSQKNSDKFFCFWHKFIWIGCIKLSLLRRQYLSLPVNVLTNSLKILQITNNNFFQLNYLHSSQWIWKSCCRWDWISVLPRLPSCLSRVPLKGDFLDISITTYFGVCNFRNR